jgi:hypothetical protein
MTYYSDFGPAKGTAKPCDISFAIGVYDSPAGGMPIGAALGLGPDDDGLARFRLVIGGHRLDGEWHLVDREFVRVK